MGSLHQSFCRAALNAIEEAATTKPQRFSFGSDFLDSARGIYAARLERRKYLPTEILGEPGWDILLDLFIAGCEGRRVDITSACIASGVPSTTALRWLKVLEDQNLVERFTDRKDGRRSFVALTGHGMEILQRYMASQIAR